MPYNLVTFQPKPRAADESSFRQPKVERGKSRESKMQEVKATLLDDSMLTEMKTQQFKTIGFGSVVGDKNQQPSVQKVVSRGLVTRKGSIR